MSWLFSRELAEASSVDICLDGAPCALWSGTHTQPASWLPAKTTDACRLSRSGMMFAPLTDAHGEALLMWFLEDSRARTSVWQEGALELRENDLDCGVKWRELLVRFDPDLCGWKTHQCLLEEDLEPSLLTLPRWGMMRDGELWERTTPTRLTKGTGSGFWPTPRATDGSHGGRVTPRKGLEGGNLIEAVAMAMWPTPRANDALKTGMIDGHNPRNGLAGAVMYPTPTVQDAHNCGGAAQLARDTMPLNAVVTFFPTPVAGNGKRVRGLDGGTGSRRMLGNEAARELCGSKLNPTFVEWLMGWPIGWTALGDMPKGSGASTPWTGASPWERCSCCEEFWCQLHQAHTSECECLEVDEWAYDPYGVSWYLWWSNDQDIPKTVRGKFAHRVPRLQCLGNGQVPAAMALAWQILSGELGRET